MEFVTESPARRLRRELGLEPLSRRLRVDDYFPFGCGNHVCRYDDERHVGIVVAVVSNNVRVRWLDTDWLEACDARDLRKVETGQ